MARCVGSVLLSLVLWSVPTLAQTSGSGEVNVVLSAASRATASGVSVTSTAQPVLKSGTTTAPHPGGTITLFDGTTALAGGPLALAADPASIAFPFAQVFGQADASLTSGGAQPSGVFGDLNGDGALDLLLVNANNYGQTMVVQGFVSAPGKFVVLPVQSFSLPQGSVPFAPALLDVNGDGYLDLLDGNTVAYGKGDGTFATPIVLPILATGFIESYAVDVDADGKLDIVAVTAPPNPLTSTGPVQFTFTVFRNTGGGQFASLGTFALAAPLPAGSYFSFNIFQLNFADLNGDGKPDVVTQSNGVPLGQGGSGNHLNALLNHGDGTFASPLPIDTAITSSLGGDAAAFGDLNGDGKIDLVLGYSHQGGNGNYIGAALGNGDGTFGAIQELLLDLPHSELATPYLQLGDFNLDGKIDAVAGTGELALGKGDGTFSLSTPLFPEQTLPNSLTPVTYPLIEASLAAGVPPSFVYLDLANSNNAVFTPVDSGSVTSNVALSAGMHSLIAHYSGDSTYAAAVSPAMTVEVAPAVTSTTVTSSTNPSYTGASVTFTATLSGLAPGAGGTVTFSNGSTTLGTAAVANGSATSSTTFASAGNATITATYTGDANDAGSTGTVNQAIEAPVAVSVGSGTPNLTVTAGQSASTTLSVAGNAGFSGPITFSCTGLPAYAACSFSPASLSLAGSAAGTTTLTVTTSAVASAALDIHSPARPFTIAACTVPLLGLVAWLPVLRRRRALLYAGLLLFAPLAALSGCGGGSSSAHAATSTAPGSYAFNVVAASTTASTSTALQLTVQ